MTYAYIVVVLGRKVRRLIRRPARPKGAQCQINSIPSASSSLLTSTLNDPMPVCGRATR